MGYSHYEINLLKKVVFVLFPWQISDTTKNDFHQLVKEKSKIGFDAPLKLSQKSWFISVTHLDVTIKTPLFQRQTTQLAWE